MGLFSAIYGLGLFCKKYADTRLRRPDRLPAKVISIGNITLGGTGKTPAVISLAREAKKRGLKPCVLTRGYKGKTKETCFVSKGEGPLLTAKEAGDEALLMAEQLKGIPVVKGSDRFRAGVFAMENDQLSIISLQHPTTFILDDGFQHWKLHRDVDVLLVDATKPFGNGKLFPEGIMREPFSALGRADIIVITKSDMAPSGAVTEITRRIRPHNAEAPVFTATHQPSGLITVSGSRTGLETLKNKKIYAFAAIANPSHFRSVLASAGAEVVGLRKFRDHYVYNQKDIDQITKDAAGLDMITTEKDLVKLRDLRLPEKLFALSIEFSVENDFYEHIFNMINRT